MNPDVIVVEYELLMDKKLSGELKWIIRSFYNRGCRLAVVTTQPRSLVEKRLEKEGLSDYVDFIQSVDSRVKYLEALKKIDSYFGLGVEKTVFLGGKIDECILASQAKVGFIGVTRDILLKRKLKEIGCSIVVNSLQDLV